MTIKEMETLSGVAKANIRYYEAEGLLSPQRLSNGYRSYSQEDLRLLEKIKLLRRLGVSVEELRSLRQGGAELAQVLDRRLAALEADRAVLRRVEAVCGALRADGPTFETLNPEKYLEALDAPAAPEETAVCPPRLPESDALPASPDPLIRLAARCLDFFFLLTLLLTVYALSGRNIARLAELGLGMNVLLEILLALLEPLLICLFGATPGKALLGLRITRADGSRLGYGEALSRHVRMLWGALGLWIPIWSWIQIYKCWRRWSDGEPQPWDEGLAYRKIPRRRLRILAPVCLAVAAALGALGAANSFSQLPPHRGDLTAAEFAENYNRQAVFLSGSTRELLTPEGTFARVPDPPGTFTVDLMEDSAWKERSFRYTLRGEKLRAVTLSCRAENAMGWMYLPRDAVYTAVTAFGWAPRETPFFASGRKPLLDALDEADWSQDFTLERDGVVITWEIQSWNFDLYTAGMGFLIPSQEGDNTLACRCTIALAEA